MRVSDNSCAPRPGRTDRFVNRAGAWYFSSREGVWFGGYVSRFDAMLAAHLLFARVSQAVDATEVRQVMAHFTAVAAVPVVRVTHDAPSDAPQPARWRLPGWQRHGASSVAHAAR